MPTFLMLLCLFPTADEAPSPNQGRIELGPSLRIDREKKQVILDAQVVLREGPLELFLCPFRTKEHESILAADVAPRRFQLALLGIGAQPGSPAQFEPEFHPPQGDPLLIEVEYQLDGQRHRHPATDWIRPQSPNAQEANPAAESPPSVPTPPPAPYHFVFAGSRFVRIPGEQRARWLGDDGDLICVANFPGSVVDVDIPSNNANASLLFHAWTDRIPPKGTPVTVYLSVQATPPKAP